MSEEALVALLANDVDIGCDDRIDLEFARTPTTRPYIVYFVEATDPTVSHSGGAGLSRRTFRIECYGGTQLAARAVADAVRKKLQGFKGTVASVRIDAVIVTDGGRTESIMPDDGDQRPESIRVIVVAMWFADANN